VSQTGCVLLQCEDSYSAMHETSKPFRQIAGQRTHCISCLCLYVGVRPLIPCSVSVGAQVKPGGEYDGVNPLLDDLPTELPVKDALPLQRQGLNPEDKGPMPIDEDSLEGLPWEFIINKDARQEWARMDRPFRSASVQFNTQQIAFCYTSQSAWSFLSFQMLWLCAWCREKVIKVLQRIGQGQWEVDGNTERRLGDVR